MRRFLQDKLLSCGCGQAGTGLQQGCNRAAILGVPRKREKKKNRDVEVPVVPIWRQGSELLMRRRQVIAEVSSDEAGLTACPAAGGLTRCFCC